MSDVTKSDCCSFQMGVLSVRRSVADQRHGFTLIELLVVISIISLLVAILLPALAKAREVAKTLQCAAQVRSVGMAMNMYSIDYKGHYPAQFMPGNLSSQRPGFSFWWQLALQYAGDNKKMLQCPMVDEYDTFWPINWDSTWFETAYGLNYTGWSWKNSSPSSWTLGEPGAGFGYIIQSPANPGVNHRGGVVNDAEIRSPSSFIMAGDTNRSINTSTILAQYTFGSLGAPRANGAQFPTEQIPDLHNDGANIVFVDGHATLMKSEELLADENLHMWKRGGK